MRPAVRIVDKPSRNIDAGAGSRTDRLMRRLSDAGAGILKISSDMAEIIGVGERVAVMHEGRIAGLLERDGPSEAAILSLAAGRLAA